MAKSTMNKVSKKVAKMDKSTLAIILVSLALVIVVTVILVRKSKREGFALMDLSNASFVTQGEDGADGAQGAQGADGANGAVGPEGPEGPAGDDYIPSQEDKNALYDEFKGKIMKEMVQKKLLVNDGTEENPTYFPVGVIGMKTVIDDTKKRIDHNSLNGDVRHFQVKYNKKAKNSYIKITYSICYTGHNCWGFTLRVFSREGSTENQIGGTQGQNGPWQGDFQRIAPQAVNIIGIDNSNTTGEKNYFCKLDNEGRHNNNSAHTYINGLMFTTDKRGGGWIGHKWHKDNLLKSSCTIEEIMTKPLEDGETSNLGEFINN